MLNDSDLYDLSEFPVNHPLYNPINKKIGGKMKYDVKNGL